MKACPVCQGPGARHRSVGEHRLVKCRDCRFVYAEASDLEIERVNSQYGESTEQHYGDIQTGLDFLWFDRISAWLTSGRKGLRVLDIGCGNGVLLRRFEDKGCICFGSDPSPWARACAERYGYTLLPCIEDADIAPGFFDIITSTSTLEHVARPREHVQRIMEVLKPGGTAYFTLPNYGSLPIRLHLVQGRLVGPPSHCNYFTTRTLRKLFRQEGLNEQVARLRVRSYGIPEIHGVYQRFSRRRPKVARSGPGNPSRKLWLRKALVSLYYWSGTPWGLGDKLEVTVEKNASGSDRSRQRKSDE